MSTTNQYYNNRIQEGLVDRVAGNQGHVADIRDSINEIAHNTFEEAIVREVFFEPTVLDDKRIDELITKYKINQTNYLKRLPFNAILAEYPLNGTKARQPPEIFFPFFPSHFNMPIKPGERVWVYNIPNKISDYGYWICRITEPRDIEDLNITHSDRKLDLFTKPGEEPKFNNGVLLKGKNGAAYEVSTASLNGSENEYEDVIQDSDAGSITDFEAVPRYIKRPGDLSLQGSNNTLIVLGTDRTGNSSEIETKEDVKNRKGKRIKGKPQKDVKLNSGTIDMVVGRGQEKSKSKIKKVKNSLKFEENDKSQNNPDEGLVDFENDLSRIYITMKSAVDENFKTTFKKAKVTNLEKNKEGAAIVMKSNNLRFIARDEVRILVQPDANSPESDCPAIILRKDGDIVIVPAEKGIVKIGGEDADKALLCSDVGVSNAGGQIVCPPLVTTMGGIFGANGAHGTFAKKIMVK